MGLGDLSSEGSVSLQGARCLAVYFIAGILHSIIWLTVYVGSSRCFFFVMHSSYFKHLTSRMMHLMHVSLC